MSSDSPPQYRLHARNQNARAERLGDVVCGTYLEPHDDVCLGALGREHDDRYVSRGDVGFEASTDLEPVDAGQHEVEDDEVGAAGPRRRQGCLARGHASCRETFLLEVVLDQRADIGLVVDHENVLVGHRHQ